MGELNFYSIEVLISLIDIKTRSVTFLNINIYHGSCGFLMYGFPHLFPAIGIYSGLLTPYSF